MCACVLTDEWMDVWAGQWTDSMVGQNPRPRRDSNPQSSDPKSDALSIRPRSPWTDWPHPTPLGQQPHTNTHTPNIHPQHYSSSKHPTHHTIKQKNTTRIKQNKHSIPHSTSLSTSYSLFPKSTLQHLWLSHKLTHSLSHSLSLSLSPTHSQSLTVPLHLIHSHHTIHTIHSHQPQHTLPSPQPQSTNEQMDRRTYTHSLTRTNPQSNRQSQTNQHTSKQASEQTSSSPTHRHTLSH